ncbi:MAG: 6-bladed beta-propeller [Candidatus Aminicenantaceae bacterium]
MFRTQTTIAAIILSLISFIAACDQPAADWQGTIEEIDGITVVRNPKEPIYGVEVVNLEEELTIGAVEGAAETMFAEVSGVVVSEDGRIFVLDAKECHIQVFDARGNYLNSIGRKGQGPGETQNPRSIQVTPQSEIMVRDLQGDRMLFYTLEGEFLRDVLTAEWGNLSKPLIDSQGNIIADYSIPGQVFRRELSKFDSRLDTLFTIHNLELFKLPVMKAFFPEFFWQVTKSDRIIWGFSTRYELQVLDSEGSLLRKITKEFSPVPITEEDKQDRMHFLFGGITVPGGITLEWPEHHWAFGDLSLDEEGRIFTRTFEKTPDGKSYVYDVFDPEGRFIAKIPIPAKPQAWKNHKLYLTEEDEDGFQYVKRYRVTWTI